MGGHNETEYSESAPSGTRAYAYLNVRDPLCAWATYRGVLVSPPHKPGFVSVWHAGVLKDGNEQKVWMEQAMETVRRKRFPEFTSRLRGMFCFMDFDSSIRARSWGRPFVSSHLSELEVSSSRSPPGQHDANWYTWAMDNSQKALKDQTWITRYWSGEPYPSEHPIWETIVDGRFTVLGTDLRNWAYDRIKKEFPDSLAWLEIARITACVGSDLGSISAFLKRSHTIDLIYVMNLKEADDPNLLDRIGEFKRSGNPTNHQDIAPHFSRDSFGCVPNLRPYGCSWRLPE